MISPIYRYDRQVMVHLYTLYGKHDPGISRKHYVALRGGKSNISNEYLFIMHMLNHISQEPKRFPQRHWQQRYHTHTRTHTRTHANTHAAYIYDDASHTTKLIVYFTQYVLLCGIQTAKYNPISKFSFHPSLKANRSMPKYKFTTYDIPTSNNSAMAFTLQFIHESKVCLHL